MIKKILIIIMAIVIGCIGCMAAMPAYANTAVYCAFYKDTPIYADKNIQSSVIKTLAQNEQVMVISTEIVGAETFCKVNTEQGEGYILSTALYRYRAPSSAKVIVGRATAEKIGIKIYIYSSLDALDSPIATITDGTNLDIIESNDKDFYKIKYQDKIAYISAKNVTTGMSYYQQMALIIGLITLVAVASILFLVYYGKNSKANKKRTLKS